MSDKNLYVEVITPAGYVYKGETYCVNVPGAQGTLGFYPGHVPMMVQLIPGALELKDHQGNKERYFIRDGFVEIKGDKVAVVSRAVELDSTIDITRAEAALKKGQDILADPANADNSSILNKYEASVARAEARIKIAKEAKERK